MKKNDCINKTRYKDENLPVEMIQNGLILPNRNRLGGVLDETGCLIQNSLFSDGKTTLWGGKYDISEEERAYRDEEVIFIGHFQKHWGNFLFDCTTRMWYLFVTEKKCRLAYCAMDFDAKSFKEQTGYRKFLEMVGIDPNRMLLIDHPTQFSNVIIPALSGFPGQFYRDEYLYVFQKMMESVESRSDIRSYEKLYLTRERMLNCKEIGEKWIENIFSNNGYHVIAPEELTLEEQVYLISHCKVFASIEGTTSHNILFALNSTKHIILRKQNYINTRQILFDEIKMIKPSYVDIFREPFRGFPLSHDAGPFWVGITKSLKCWMERERFKNNTSKCRYFFESIKEFMIYTAKCIYYKYWLKY